MWRFVLAIAIVAMATDAREIMSKRAVYIALDSHSFASFFQQFGGTLAHIIGGEYNETKPWAETLRSDMAQCKTRSRPSANLVRRENLTFWLFQNYVKSDLMSNNMKMNDDMRN